MTSSGFLPHIIHPTRIMDYTFTIIDNIYSNNFEDNSTGGNILIQFADHLSQFLCIDKYVERRKPIDIFKRNYSNFDENKFLDDIAIQDWNSNNNTNIYFDNFLTTLENCLEKHAPMKKLNKKQIQKISKPWISNYITKLISHRERLFNKKKRNPLSIEIKRAYTLFRHRITREIKAKKEYYKNYLQVNMNNMKNLWKGIKNILNINNKGDSNISQLSLDGKTITGNKGMANSFNKFFTEVGPNLDKLIPNSNVLQNANVYLPPRIPHSLLLYPSTPNEIGDIVEAHNTLFNYDLISICETSLNDSVELPETLLDDYTFLPANNPANVRHGGVGNLFKNSLPVIV